MNLKAKIIEVLMVLSELPECLSAQEKTDLEDRYDELFPESRGKVTPFIRWLWRGAFWLGEANV